MITDNNDNVFDDDDYDISEMPEYSRKSDFSKAELVKDAVKNCIEKRGQEMKYGFWNTKISKEGIPMKEWKPDTRKEFIAAVDALRGLLNPEIQRDENFKNLEKTFRKQAAKLFEIFAYKELISEIKNDGKTYGGVIIYKESERKYMPDIGTTLLVRDPQNPQLINSVRGGWDKQINGYWDSLLGLYDNLFGALNDLIDRNNYFKQAISF